MKSIKSISRLVAVAGAIAFAAQFAMVPAAFAKGGVSGGGGGGGGKPLQCGSMPVAGQPGTYIWICTAGRP